jgi:hypothetical protein
LAHKYEPLGREKLVTEQAKVLAGIPVPAKSWKLGPYLD